MIKDDAIIKQAATFQAANNIDLKNINDHDAKTVSTLDSSNTFYFNTAKPITGFGYLPRQDGQIDGMISKFELYDSEDGKLWSLVKAGEFANIKSNPILQQVFLTKGKSLYYKLVVKDKLGNGNATISEWYTYSE